MARPDVNARPIAWGGAAIALAVLLAVAAVFALLRHWQMPSGRELLPDDAGVVHAISGPALQSAPQLDLAQYRRDKQQRLDSIGWVDARRGLVHIPIESAMDILAQPAAAAASSARRQAP